MATYVDDANVKGRWYHLSADSIRELHDFAARIGLKRHWYHRASRHPHYDITGYQRQVAIEAGAVPVGKRELLRIAKQCISR